jgi:2-polyprenyl-3-methyl-5-hydroxy-6-metoxy-1,4-benzoquinol methylase
MTRGRHPAIDSAFASSNTIATEYPRTLSLRELNAQLVDGMDRWQRLDACPACDSGSLTRFATIRYLSYSRCRGCGLTFANPVPPEEVLDAFYNSPFYANYRRLEATRIRRERYFSNSMYTDMRRLAAWLGADPSLAVLDFGCGPGAFLALLRDEFGFANIEGLELSRSSAAFARQQYGLHVASSTAELRSELYDWVILIEVIEHLPNPAAILREVTGRVRPGGGLLITTPAVDSIVGRFFPALCHHYTAPSHVSLFTQQALTRLLARFGFTIERLEVADGFLSLDRLGMSLAYDLDFVSPRHDDDDRDPMYVPNTFGRLLGLQPERSPGNGRFRRALQRADRFLLRHVWWRMQALPKANHLFVLARKQAQA